MKNLDRLLKIIVGSRFGDSPSLHLSSIRNEKHDRARGVADLLDLQDTDHVLEIGGGCGWSAQILAPPVAKYVLTDISEAFVEYAKSETADLPQVQVEVMNYGKISQYKNLLPTVIVALDVFTQFSFYDYVIYLKGISETLTPGGRCYFNFMNSQFLNVKTNEKLLRHEELFLKDPQSAPLLLHWMEPACIERMLKDLHLEILKSHLSDNHSWYLVSKKTSADL